MNLRNIAAVLTVLLFVTVGVHNVVDNQNKLDLKNIQLKSTATELKTLELKYDNLQIELNKTDKANTEQIKKLQDEKNQLEQERIKLQGELQAKKASKLQVAATSIPLSGTAYASPGGAKAYIYGHESGNNPGAINASSGACGLGQALPCSKMPCSLSDYVCQDQFFTSYMLSRYGSWENAQAFWIANHYW